MSKSTSYVHTIEIVHDDEAKCWLAMFNGGDELPQGEWIRLLPQGEWIHLPLWIPLPFTPQADAATVARDLLSRFPMAEVKSATHIYKRRPGRGHADPAPQSPPLTDAEIAALGEIERALGLQQ